MNPHCDFTLVVKAPGEHSRTHFRVVHEIGIDAIGGNPICAAIAEVCTSRSSEDNYSDAAERERAERLAACWNACHGLTLKQIKALKLK